MPLYFEIGEGKSISMEVSEEDLRKARERDIHISLSGKLSALANGIGEIEVRELELLSELQRIFLFLFKRDLEILICSLKGEGK